MSAADDPARAHSPHRHRRAAFLTGAVAFLLVLVVIIVAAAAHRGPFGSAAESERVINGSAATDLTGWFGASQAGTLDIRRVSAQAGPAGRTTAVDVSRAGGTGSWAFLLTALHDPAADFTVGHTYRMQAYVRNLRAPAGSIGLLLANDHFAHRPTGTTQYATYGDGEWHLLSATFRAGAGAATDTGLYFALPPSGALHWQVTAASVLEVAAGAPTPAATVVAATPSGGSGSGSPSQGSDAPSSTTPGAGSASGTPGPSGSASASGSPSTSPATSASRVLTFGGPAGSAPDPSVWGHEIGGGGWGNKEIQTYTDDVANAQLNGKGELTVNARREDKAGPDKILRHYTSARLSTAGKVTVQPGSYVEARVKVPIGTGVWPAFWMIGTDISTVGWPACGELDIFEAVGASPNGTTTTIHMAHRSDANAVASYGGRGGLDTPAAAAARSITHVYGVYFDSSVVRFYVDHRERLVLHATKAHAMGWTWPFAKSMYIILNVAVGGPAGDPTGHTFPRTMTVGPISIWDSGVPF